MSAANVHHLPQLRGENYTTWKFRVRALLEEKQVLDVLEKDEATIKSNDTFKKNNAIAKSTIIQCITDKHLHHIQDCVTANDMFVTLDSIFQRKSVFTKLTIRRKLLALKLTKDSKLEDHFQKFDQIIRELESLDSKLTEEDKICHLLLSLNQDYEYVITAIETLNTNITIEFVKSRLLDEEIKINNKSTAAEMSFQANTSNTYRRGKGNNRWRRNYNRYQHRGRGQADRGHSTFSFIALNAMSTPNNHLTNFILDSGATFNMVISEMEQSMTDVQTLSKPIDIHIANGQILYAMKRGTISGMYNDQKIDINALIVPGLSHNLLSVNSITMKGYNVTFSNKNVIIEKNGSYLEGQNVNNNLYVVQFEVQRRNHTAYAAKTNEDTLWHRRLGHLNRKGLRLLGLPASDKKCESCIEGKSTRRSFHTQEQNESVNFGNLIHSDLCGPFTPTNINGERYFQVIIDDYSHYVVVKLLKNKNEAEQNIINFIKYIKTQFGCKTKKLRVDNGGEFSSKAFKSYCSSKGIDIQYTAPYSPQQNGKSERMNRTLMDKVRTKFAETNLPKELWGEAIYCSAYELNRCPTRALGGQSPAMIWYGKSQLSKLRVFGSRCWIVTLPKPDKLNPRAKPMIMVGYYGSGYKLWDPINNKIIISTDVTFDETNTYYTKNNEGNEEKDNATEYIIRNEICEEIQEKDKETEKINEQISELDNSEQGKFLSAEEQNEKTEVTTQHGREIHKPKHLDDYQLFVAYCLLTHNNEDPISYKQAIEDKEWKEAIDKEIESLQNLKTWTPTNLPKEKKAIDTKWVFRTKENGIKKARLVAKGFQVKDEDYLDTNYAPVARMSTVRMFLAHSIAKNMGIHQLDIPTAFLNGKLDSEIYIKIPQGVTNKDNKVLKLNRSLYGLKESPRCWNECFNEFAIKAGLKRSMHDFCLYYNKEIWLLIFVDDMLLMGEEKAVQHMKEILQKEYKTKYLGEIKKFLGMEIGKYENGMKITQNKQIEKILEKFEMTECNGTKTPMEKGLQIDLNEETVNVPYRELIGNLMYIATVSRPDISFAVSYLSQFLDKPNEQCWKSVKRVVRYLKQTKDYGLYYERHDNESMCLEAYSDADWAGDKLDRKSVSGCVVLYNGNVVAWFSRKQNCVALSTAEAEYIAAATSACELQNIKGLSMDFGCDVIPIIKMDNKGAICISKSFENSKRSKHIDIKYHFIKNLIKEKQLIVTYVNSNDNTADIFTKSLSVEKFEKFRSSLKVL